MAHRNEKYVNKFKLPKILEYNKVSLKGVPRNWDKPQEYFLSSPKTLGELAVDVLDRQPLPECIYWPNDRVLEWVENTLKLPEYKETFMVNLVTGKQLILIEPNHLVKMNIHKWDHIKKIMVGIRQLYGVSAPKYAQDLTMPVLFTTEYSWDLLYYRFIAPTTPSLAVPRSQYWRSSRLITTKPEPVCHWFSMGAVPNKTDKVVVARVEKRKKERLFVPMFRENHFVSTTINVYYLSGDPLTV